MVGCVQAEVGNKNFIIKLKYLQRKEMSTRLLKLI